MDETNEVETTTEPQESSGNGSGGEPETPPDPPEDERLTKAQKIGAEVDEAEREYLSAAEHAKSLKKIFEARDSELRRFIRNMNTPPAKPDPQQTLLFKDEPEPAPVESEPWRAFPLAEVAGFPLTVLEALESIEVRTMGELSEWSAFRKFADLPLVGPATADKADAALLGFWAAHPEFTQDAPKTAQDAAPSDSGGNPIQTSTKPENAVASVVVDSTASEKPKRGRPRKPKTAAAADELADESRRAADLRIAESLLRIAP